MLSPRIISTTLLLLGLFLLFHSTVNLSMHRSGVRSNFSAFESKLSKWVSSKIAEGKLTQEDRAEIFDEPYSLKVGGESDSQNFHQMIRRMTSYGEHLRWPGIAAILIGVAGLIRHRKLRRGES